MSCPLHLLPGLLLIAFRRRHSEASALGDKDDEEDDVEQDVQSLAQATNVYRFLINPAMLPIDSSQSWQKEQDGR